MVTYLQKHERLSAEERKQQLIDVAIDLFSKKGFGGTTTKEIAAAAGVNEAIIFRHFATKQALYAAILDSKMGEPRMQALAEMSALMEGDDDEAVFGWLLRKVIEIYRCDQRFERLMLYAALEGHEIGVMHHNQVSPFLEALQKYIRRRQRDGALVECDPFLVITSVVGPAKQFAMGKYLFGWNKTEQDDERVAATLTQVFLDGFRVKAKRKKK